MAMSYLVRGHLVYADDKLKELAQGQPQSAQAQLGYSLLLKVVGRKEEYRDRWDRAKKLSPELDDELRELLAQRGGKKQKGIKGKGKDPNVAISDGLVKESLGDPKGALVNYNHAIAVDPKLWLAWAFRALLKIELKDCDGAKLDMAEAVRINPDYKRQAQFCLNQCY